MLEGEENIVKKARQGKPDAFGLLYDHYHSSIYRFVLLKVGRREDAEDLTHQVFMNAWQNIGNYKSQGFPFSSWLYQIARNQVIDFYRTRKNDLKIEDLDPDFIVAPALSAFIAERNFEMEKVMAAVRKLKPEYQDVIIMRFVEDLPLKEIAEVLGKSEGAVKLIQHRAIKQLRNFLSS